MSNKTQLQTNNTALDALITRVNTAKDVAASLPDAGGSGGGGGSVETCTVTITPDRMPAPTVPTYYYTDAETMTIKSITTTNAIITVPKNTIIAIKDWSSSSTTSGTCNQLFYSMMHAAYSIEGNSTFTFMG